MKISKLLFSTLLLSVLFISCDDDNDDEKTEGAYDNGILISGEGGSTGSVYYVSNDFSITESLIYKNVNNEDLGKYLQSIAFDDDNAYLIVDNQNTITVVDRYTFEKIGTITTGLKKPRYMAIVGDKGYVTNWAEGSWGADVDDDYIAVVDLNTFEVTSTISLSIGVERIIANNGKLYVSHKGGNDTNNIISVIDISTEAITEITVNDNPDEIFFDNSGDLIVLCEGKTTYDPTTWAITEQTLASITTINTSTNTVASKLEFPSGTQPSLLDIDASGNLYYSVYNNIYKVEENATVLPTSVYFQTTAGSHYGLAIKDNNLYVVDAGDFASEGDLLIYDLTTQSKIQSFKAPIAASKIYFN
ncbi:YncE family protein [Lutibacter sp.]|uniref:YncE family protein n=1 Tax=Lutibacter sp. TaxID=1925666 RepID=UPI0035661B28